MDARAEAAASYEKTFGPAVEPIQPATPDTSGKLRAELLVQRAAVSVEAQVPLLLHVQNGHEHEVRVQSVTLHASPAGSAQLSHLDFSGPVPPPVVEPGGDAHLALSCSFLHPRFGQAREYAVGASVRFTDGSQGSQVEAEPTTITVRPIA
ncbi:hypothetical protein [Anaeromyxobacter diazotrophicus]|nr:hypothetical protein [Anaeromyxobacter diazotrophicus]